MNASSANLQVSPILIGVVVIALVAFVIWRGVSAFSGPPTGKLPPPPAGQLTYLRQEAMQCQGDITKLDPADQTKIQQITHGFGEAAMQSQYRIQTQK